MKIGVAVSTRNMFSRESALLFMQIFSLIDFLGPAEQVMEMSQPLHFFLSKILPDFMTETATSRI